MLKEHKEEKEKKTNDNKWQAEAPQREENMLWQKLRQRKWRLSRKYRHLTEEDQKKHQGAAKKRRTEYRKEIRESMEKHDMATLEIKETDSQHYRNTRWCRNCRRIEQTIIKG